MERTRSQGLKRLKEQAGWVFLAAVGALYAGVGLIAPSLGAEALNGLVALLERVLPALLLVFALLFLANLLLDRQWLTRRLGRGAGV